MPINGKLALVGLAALGALLALGGESHAQPAEDKQPDAPKPPSGDKSSCIDPNMPAAMADQVKKALASTSITADTLDGLAAAAGRAGFPIAAACLKKQADGLRAVEQMKQAAIGMPFQVRQGDMPYFLAIYYTGDGSRYHELAEVNPSMGALKTVKNADGTLVSNYTGWKPGLKILIPNSWHPYDKALPAPLKGGGYKPSETYPDKPGQASITPGQAAGLATQALASGLDLGHAPNPEYPPGASPDERRQDNNGTEDG